MRSITMAVICVLLASASFADDQALRGRTRFTYFACVSPPEAARCYAFTEQQKGTCKPCGQWEARLFDYDFSTDFDTERYIYKNGKAHGSKLLADFEVNLTGEPTEEAPTFAQIYKSPKRYDYLEVPKGVSIQPGMLAVYPNFGGIIATQTETLSKGRIIYSSKASQGNLQLRSLATVAPEAPPRIVFNTRLFEIREPAYWNILARKESDGAPTTILRPGESYNLRVDLSAFQYRGESLAGEVSTNAQGEIQSWLTGTAANLDLDLVLVTGDEFDDSNDRHQGLRISLDKMRTWYGSTTPAAPPRLAPNDALAEVTQDVQPDYLFSSGSPFQVHTAEAAKGMATLTVTMWKGIPIDEITFSLCIASETEEEAVCHGKASILSRGFGAVPEMTEPTSSPPDVAVTFVAADPNHKVHGILRDNRPGSDGTFVQWKLNKTMKDLRTYVSQTLEPALNTDNLVLTGFGLYKELFTTQVAREALSRIISAEMATPVSAEPVNPPAGAPLGAVTNPPRIHFRIIDADGLTTLPVSFLVWQRENGAFEPIGFHYILDVPLGGRVTQHSECVSRWMLLYPSVPEAVDNPDEQDAIIRAVLRAKSTLIQWSTVAQKPFLANDINSFGGWLASGAETAGAAIVLLAHHASDRMWFSTNQPITASLVGRSFQSPTIAILDGCGTGGSAANEFAKRLSVNGVNAIVVTNTNIAPDLAGDYLNVLAEELSADQSRPGFNFAYAHFNALRRLRGKENTDINPTLYRERALSFMLVGNGNLKLCTPQ
jgi:hypothetical protein